MLFAILGTVVWHAVWPLGAGALLGGLIGPAIARRVRPASCGFSSPLAVFVLAGWLLLR